MVYKGDTMRFVYLALCLIKMQSSRNFYPYFDISVAFWPKFQMNFFGFPFAYYICAFAFGYILVDSVYASDNYDQVVLLRGFMTPVILALWVWWKFSFLFFRFFSFLFNLLPSIDGMPLMKLPTKALCVCGVPKAKVKYWTYWWGWEGVWDVESLGNFSSYFVGDNAGEKLYV